MCTEYGDCTLLERRNEASDEVEVYFTGNHSNVFVTWDKPGVGSPHLAQGGDHCFMLGCR
jgi:hypothetical protein